MTPASRRGAGRVEFSVNGRIVGEAADIKAPVRFGAQFTTVGDGLRLLAERNLVLEAMAESASPLLAVLGAVGREALSKKGSFKRWKAGKVVMREGEEVEGEEEEGMYLIMSGQAVAKQASKSGPPVLVYPEIDAVSQLLTLMPLIDAC
eukprot:3255283-Rhodomonas_salina.1